MNIPMDKKMIPKFLVLGYILLSFVGNVYAGVTSSFVRQVFPAEDMPLDHPAFAKPSGYNAPEQVKPWRLYKLSLF